jgi:hypothetical protein
MKPAGLFMNPQNHVNRFGELVSLLKWSMLKEFLGLIFFFSVLRGSMPCRKTFEFEYLGDIETEFINKLEYSGVCMGCFMKKNTG